MVLIMNVSNDLNFTAVMKQLDSYKDGCLDGSSTGMFLASLCSQKPDLGLTYLPRTNDYVPEPPRNPQNLTERIREFQSSKNKRLFIPLTINGYEQLPKNAPLAQRISHFFGAIKHFLQGGCIESHSVLLTVKKDEKGEGFSVEYYDPKGRSPNTRQSIQDIGSNTNPLPYTIVDCFAEIENQFKVKVTQYKQGRFEADQSIFNTNECGFFVINRILEQSNIEDYRAAVRNLADLVKVAQGIIRGSFKQQPENQESGVEILFDDEF